MFTGSFLIIIKDKDMIRNKFTLIELLMVIAVIAILASMLLSSIARARRTAQLAVSVSNEKQIGLAIKMYMDDNDSYYPYARAPGQGVATPCRVWGRAPY